MVAKSLLKRQVGIPAVALSFSCRGHWSLEEVRKAGPHCQKEPRPRSARVTDPLVPRSAGLRVEGTWVKGSNMEHLVANSSLRPAT